MIITYLLGRIKICDTGSGRLSLVDHFGGSALGSGARSSANDQLIGGGGRRLQGPVGLGQDLGLDKGLEVAELGHFLKGEVSFEVERKRKEISSRKMGES